jgi:hypothetical protein
MMMITMIVKVCVMVCSLKVYVKRCLLVRRLNKEIEI